MRSAIDFLAATDLPALAADPRVLFFAAVLFVLAVLFRWKAVMLFLFACGAAATLMRYAGLTGEGAEGGGNVFVLAGGTLLIGIVLVYFLFVRGD